MAKSNLSFDLSDLPRVGGTLFGLAYGVGLLIVSLRLSDFGIAEFSFFKPRIFAVGTLFLLLTFVSCLAALRIQGLMGLRSYMVLVTRPITHLKWWRVYSSFLFYQMSVGLALVTRFVLTDENYSSKLEFHLLGIPAAAGVALAIVAGYVFDRFWRSITFGSFFVSLIALVAVLAHSGYALFWLSAWYYIVGMASVFAYLLAKDSTFKRYFEWEWLPFLIAAAIVCYSLKIYPTIKPQFGGGASTSVLFTFSDHKPVPFPADQEVQLIDETEQGYYVSVPRNDQRSVYFVRRDLVEAVRFK